MSARPDLTPLLRALRGRMLVRGFLRAAARATLVFYTLLVVLNAVAWGLGALPDASAIPLALVWPVVAGGLAAGVITFFKCPSLRQVAETVDALGGTRDRLVTALDFSAKERATDMEALALRESVAFAGGRDFRALLPIRPPRELRWLAVPLITLGILWWDGLRVAARQKADLEQRVASARAQTAGTVKRLETIADQLRTRVDPDLMTRMLAERLKQSAMQVTDEANKGNDTQQAALRELAELEQLVKDLRRPAMPTEKEMKALAGALAKDEKLKDAAKDIAQGNFAEAAKKLDEAAKDLPTAERAQKIIQEALEHLARQKEQLSKELEGMRQEADGADEQHQQLLQQLSEVLNEMKQSGQLTQKPQEGGKSGPQPGAGKPMTDEDLKHLLSALQQMKEDQQSGAEPQPGESDDQQDGKEKSAAIAVQSFSDKDASGKPDDHGDPTMPSGKPGSELDKGTTASPFGAKTEAPEKGQAEQVRGKLGDGESLSTLVPSAAKGDAKATRRYKELTEAAAAEAAEAVTQEEIPLGARFLIRRYFEAIRVK